MKVIRFVPEIDNKEAMLLEPEACKKHVPQWYRDGEFHWVDENGNNQAGLKTCKPFIDVMIGGYFLLIPFDIHVTEDENGKIGLKWDGPDEWAGFVGERPGAIGATIPVPAGHRKNHLIWASRWGWKTPRGWSTIVTHPFNRGDLPFRTMSATIDSDKFFTNGNIPFHLREGWTGTIPAGTPFAQIIPVKRDSWRSFVDLGLTALGKIKSANVRVEQYKYKNVEWVKKDYE
jgi:hypothetical protein